MTDDSEKIRLVAQVPLVSVDSKLGYAPAEFHPEKDVAVREGEEYYVKRNTERREER